MYKGIRAAYAPLQARTGQQDDVKTTYCSHGNSMASSGKSPGAESAACSPDLSPMENIWRVVKRKIRQRRPPDSSAAGNLYRARGDPDSSTKTPESRNLDAQTSSKCSKCSEGEVLHRGGHAPVPTVLKPVASIRFQINSFCA